MEKVGKYLFQKDFYILLKRNTNDAQKQNFIKIPQKTMTGFPNLFKLVKLTLPLMRSLQTKFKYLEFEINSF